MHASSKCDECSLNALKLPAKLYALKIEIVNWIRGRGIGFLPKRKGKQAKLRSNVTNQLINLINCVSNRQCLCLSNLTMFSLIVTFGRLYSIYTRKSCTNGSTCLINVLEEKYWKKKQFFFEIQKWWLWGDSDSSFLNILLHNVDLCSIAVWLSYAYVIHDICNTYYVLHNILCMHCIVWYY